MERIDVAVLCGGLGIRLRPVLRDRAKPMAPIAGRPFLDRLLEYLAARGFRRFVLCAGYRADSIEEYFLPGRTPWDVRVVREGRPLGTAGALRHARAELHSDPCVVLNGDSFCRIDYRRLLRAHQRRHADLTLALVRTDCAGDYGLVAADKAARITAFEEKRGTPGPGWVNAGVYVIRRTVLDNLPRRTPLSLERDVFPNLISARLFAYLTRGPLLDIGTPARYARAQTELTALMDGSGPRRGTRA